MRACSRLTNCGGSFSPDSAVVTLPHWDDVDAYRRANGEMDATWQSLGDAGTRTVGVRE